MSRSAAAPILEIPLDRVDLDALDKFLSSERAPPDAMSLSDLDGFLTGIAVGPGLVMPSEWLPLVWGGQAPEFADEAEAQTILGAIFARYNEILREIADDAFDPICWIDRDGALIPFAWVDGFLRAMMLRIDAWRPLLLSKQDGFLLFPILALCRGRDGDLLLNLRPDEENRLAAEMTECIPAAVAGIARYWRGRRSMPLIGDRASPFDRPAPKVGRNEPCPCGSGKKFKKCCGKAG